jgi:hypothetical protein
MDHEFEQVITRSESLVFGIFAHGDDEEGTIVTRVAGSGMFVAPCYGLTARHVVQDLLRLNPGRADDLTRRNSGYVLLPHWFSLFQIPNSGTHDGPSAVWGVTRTWDPGLGDLCLLEAADGPEATSHLNDMRCRFPEWSLLQPPVGSVVEIVGFPGGAATLGTKGARFSFRHDVLRATVREIYEQYRDRGMYSFPCFAVDKGVDHGISGSPVFWNGRLCGVVSGGTTGDVDATYVASLWPLCQMEIEFPNLGALNRKESIGDWFDRGLLDAADWQHVKRRASLSLDGDGIRRFRLRDEAAE